MAEQTPEPRRSSAPKSGGQQSGNPWIGLAGVGFEFIFSILLPGAVGWWLDKKFGTAPWLMLVGGMIGFASGLVLLMKTVKNSQR